MQQDRASKRPVGGAAGDHRQSGKPWRTKLGMSSATAFSRTG